MFQVDKLRHLAMFQVDQLPRTDSNLKLTIFCGPWKIQELVSVKMSQLGSRDMLLLGRFLFWELGHPLPWLSGVLSGWWSTVFMWSEIWWSWRNNLKICLGFAGELPTSFKFWLFFSILFSKRKIRHLCFNHYSISHPIHKFLPRSLFDKLLEFAASLWGSDFGCFVANVWASWLHLEWSTWCATAGHSCHTATEWKAWGGCQQMSLKMRRSVVALEVIDLSIVERIKQYKRI